MTTVPQIDLPASRSSPGVARRFAVGELDQRVESLGDVLLCVSELVANAVLHAATACVLTITCDDETVRIAVRDLAPERLPVRRDFERTAITGRGLRLVELLSARWGIDRDDTSKTVWFEVPALPAEAAS